MLQVCTTQGSYIVECMCVFLRLYVHFHELGSICNGDSTGQKEEACVSCQQLREQVQDLHMLKADKTPAWRRRCRYKDHPHLNSSWHLVTTVRGKIVFFSGVPAGILTSLYVSSYAKDGERGRERVKAWSLE